MCLEKYVVVVVRARPNIGKKWLEGWGVFPGCKCDVGGVFQVVYVAAGQM